MSFVTSVIFRDDDLIARFVGGFSDDVCVVTFDSYTDVRSLDRTGFGEGFFAKNQIDAVHVMSKDNVWYLHEGMAGLCLAVKEFIKKYRKAVSYGSSMGGYASIRFGKLVGASAAIAISPQFTIDRAIAPFENRWGESEEIDFSMERGVVAPFVERSFIVYDPHSLDRRHADLYRPHTLVVDVAIPYSGHPASGYLAQVALLKPLLENVIAERFDSVTFVHEARTLRRASADYFFTLAQHGHSAKRKARIAAKFVELTGNDPVYEAHYAWWLALAGDRDAAKEKLERLAAVPQNSPIILFRLSQLYELLRDYSGGVAVMEKLIAAYPTSPNYKQRRDLLVGRLNDQTHEARQKKESRHAPLHLRFYRWASAKIILADRGKAKP